MIIIPRPIHQRMHLTFEHPDIEGVALNSNPTDHALEGMRPSHGAVGQSIGDQQPAIPSERHVPPDVGS